MVRNNAEGVLEGQETILQIKNTIAEYEERISMKLQRDAFNPFDLIEERIISKNLSKKERYEKLMEEAQEAILKRLGPDFDPSTGTSKEPKESSLFEDSQDPQEAANDKEMADYFKTMAPRSSKLTSSESDSMQIEDDVMSEEDILKEFKGSKKKKNKGKGKKK